MKVVYVNRETPDTIVFRLDGEMDYLPGQFIMLECEVNSEMYRRAYSIASSPTEPHIELCVKEMENGIVSTFLQNVRVGDEFKVSGPYGKFVYDGQGDILLLGAGSGIAPFRSIAKCLTDEQMNVKCTVISSHKTQKDLIYHAEFSELDITYVPTITRGEWSGRTGRVDQKLIDQYCTKDTHVFLCGPKEFVFAMKEMLNVPSDQVHMEVYG